MTADNDTKATTCDRYFIALTQIAEHDHPSDADDFETCFHQIQDTVEEALRVRP
jgi:hypothetical protein